MNNEQVSNQAWNRVRSQFCDQVLNQVSTRVWNRVGKQLWNQTILVKTQVENQAKEDIDELREPGAD